jgi:hypothetical protein
MSDVHRHRPICIGVPDQEQSPVAVGLHDHRHRKQRGIGVGVVGIAEMQPDHVIPVGDSMHRIDMREVRLIGNSAASGLPVEMMSEQSNDRTQADEKPGAAFSGDNQCD